MKLTSILSAGVLLVLGCSSLLGQNEITPTDETRPPALEAEPGLYTTVVAEGLFTTRMDDRRNGVLGMASGPAGAAAGVDRRSAAWAPSETAGAWYYGVATQKGVSQPGPVGRTVVLQTNSLATAGTQTAISTQTNAPSGRYGVDTGIGQPGAGGASAPGSAAKAGGTTGAK